MSENDQEMLWCIRYVEARDAYFTARRNALNRDTAGAQAEQVLLKAEAIYQVVEAERLARVSFLVSKYSR